MKPSPLRKYTCADYRQEMRLLALKRQLQAEDLTDKKRTELLAEVRDLEKHLEMA